VFASSKPITQANIGSATEIAVSAVPQASGSHELIMVAHARGVKHYAVRAIDHAGNIGPVAL
jgi:hypothetical protein